MDDDIKNLQNRATQWPLQNDVTKTFLLVILILILLVILTPIIYLWYNIYKIVKYVFKRQEFL